MWGYTLPIVGGICQRRLELVLNLCAAGARVLEIGFGPGFLFPNLSKLYDEVHGIDVEADAEVAAGFARRGIVTYLREGTATNLPYVDAYFDTVIPMSVLEHLHPEKNMLAAAEIARVLRPQGQLIYGAPVGPPLMRFIFRYIFRLDIGQFHFSTEIDVRRAVDRFLTPVKYIFMRPLPSLGQFTKLVISKKRCWPEVLKPHSSEISWLWGCVMLKFLRMLRILCYPRVDERIRPQKQKLWGIFPGQPVPKTFFGLGGLGCCLIPD